MSARDLAATETARDLLIRLGLRIDALEQQAADAQYDRGRLAVEAATADQDWKRAEARAVRAEELLSSHCVDIAARLLRAEEALRQWDEAWMVLAANPGIPEPIRAMMRRRREALAAAGADTP
jgi:hypothetical protein